MTSRGIVFHVRGCNGDTTLTLFRGIINTVESDGATAPNFCTHAGQRGGQSGFTMVNVTDGAYVYVRFITFKLFLCHGSIPLTN
ncbi:hypothetical protein A3725_28535 [Alcanivorax sp. HI0035]|nr:hypothetical protein A3725_28535 [Alcanivorax sp. HI0035]